jgi:hypothetical protein
MQKRSLAAFTLGAAAALGCVATVAAKLPLDAFALPALEGAKPWTGSAPLRDEGDFDFAVVTDRTGEHRDDVFERVMPPKLNLVRPEFVMSVGDMIEGYTDDRAELAKEWDEIQAATGKLAMPFFYVPGNHDMSNAVMADVWKERFGPSYYSFVYKNVLFLALNSELFGMVHDPRTPLPGPWKLDEQLAYVEKTLRENANVRWTFVFVHQPLWDVPKIPIPGQVTAQSPNPSWLRVEQMLGDRPYTVFAGHYHRYTEHVRNNRQFITLATTGGGSDLRGTEFGEFDQVARVSMTKNGPVIANLRLDGILPSDVVTAEQRTLVLALPRAIAQEPITGEAGAFRSGTARFSISNPGERPLLAVGRATGSPQLDAGDVTLRATVEPGGVANLALPIRARARRVRDGGARARGVDALDHRPERCAAFDRDRVDRRARGELRPVESRAQRRGRRRSRRVGAARVRRALARRARRPRRLPRRERRVVHLGRARDAGGRGVRSASARRRRGLDARAHAAPAGPRRDQPRRARRARAQPQHGIPRGALHGRAAQSDHGVLRAAAEAALRPDPRAVRTHRGQGGDRVRGAAHQRRLRSRGRGAERAARRAARRTLGRASHQRRSRRLRRRRRERPRHLGAPEPLRRECGAGLRHLRPALTGAREAKPASPACTTRRATRRAR